MSNNRTHRSRLARSFALESGLPYQAALSRVVSAAEAGQLPPRLDGSGMRQALDTLRTQLGPGGVGELGLRGLATRYYRLSEVVGEPLPLVVTQWVSRARAAGVMTAVEDGDYDPRRDLGYDAPIDDIDEEEEFDDDLDRGVLARAEEEGPGWLRRVIAAGARGAFALPCPYPIGADPDGYLPIDRVLDARDATGDVGAYEEALHAIVEAEPRDVDAFAHLGNLLLAIADGTGEVMVTPPLPARLRKALVRDAVEFYQSGVAVGELTLPDPVTGVLVWSNLDNRPFLRALHGLALALWQLRRFDAAEMVLLNMLWLNPNDNQGARIILPEVQQRLRREDIEEL